MFHILKSSPIINTMKYVATKQSFIHYRLILLKQGARSNLTHRFLLTGVHWREQEEGDRQGEREREREVVEGERGWKWRDQYLEQ